MKKELIHLLGGFLIFSSYYHSNMGLLPLLNIIPILLVSFAVEKENQVLEYAGLIGTSLLSGFFITHTGLADTLYLTLFITSFVLPFIVYWKIVLSFDLHFDLKASILAAAYFSATIVTFYALIDYLDISEFILAEGNTGPMALAFSAVTIMVLLPFYISVNR
ncbi:MAG: hypothetical protein R6W73_00080 [Candidatus Saliniplasma sp.]